MTSLSSCVKWAYLSKFQVHSVFKTKLSPDLPLKLSNCTCTKICCQWNFNIIPDTDRNTISNDICTNQLCVNRSLFGTKYFKNELGKICGRQNLMEPWDFLKAVFQKFYLVHSWILCLTCQCFEFTSFLKRESLWSKVFLLATLVTKCKLLLVF